MTAADPLLLTSPASRPNPADNLAADQRPAAGTTSRLEVYRLPDEDPPEEPGILAFLGAFFRR
jgi:hypothetical protein